MTLLQVHQAHKSFGARELFADVQFSINRGEHVGVIGPNGAGKTTLFKILVGQEELDGGGVVRSSALRVGYLEQEAADPTEVSAEQHLAKIGQRPLWELKRLGRELGLSEVHFALRFHELSGGYRMRMKLLALIAAEPNLMLLDEPTNFLDLESVLALEKFLQNYEGAFLLISHDREFLRRTTDHTLEVEAGEVTKFPGNIDDYFEQKQQLRTILEAQASNQAAKRKQVLDFVDRFGAKATKARQAQSRLKQLEKMEKIELRALPVRAAIRIPAPPPTGRDAIIVTDARLGYADRAVIDQCNLRIETGTHLGVVGFNGAGKSTLLKSIAGRIPLLAGERKLGHQVTLSYFAQHVADDLNPDDTVFDSLSRAADRDTTQQEILNLAGSLLFSGDSVRKKVSVLSGGEKSRVALGQILLKRTPVLLLDEPTNHLDFDTVEALTEALRSYPGTVIAVSHDRSFIGRMANQILEIRDGRAEVYPGTYDEYIWSLERGALSQRLSTAAADAAAAPTSVLGSATGGDGHGGATKVRPRDEAKKNQAILRELERTIAKKETQLTALETKVAALNTEIASGTNTPAQLETMTAELATSLASIESLENELLNAMAKREELV